MNDRNIWTLIDAYLFRAAGLIVGAGGLFALFANNPADKLFGSVYGIIFLLAFSAMALSSIYSTAKGTLISK